MIVSFLPMIGHRGEKLIVTKSCWLSLRNSNLALFLVCLSLSLSLYIYIYIYIYIYLYTRVCVCVEKEEEGDIVIKCMVRKTDLIWCLSWKIAIHNHSVCRLTYVFVLDATKSFCMFSLVLESGVYMYLCLCECTHQRQIGRQRER